MAEQISGQDMGRKEEANRNENRRAFARRKLASENFDGMNYEQRRVPYDHLTNDKAGERRNGRNDAQ